MADGTKRRRFDIEVTEEDIAGAVREDSYQCVVVHAIARSIPDATRIEVDLQTIRFSRDGERLSFLTPYSAAGYIVAFDAGDEIHPFRFRLHDPRVKPSRSRTPAGKQLKAKHTRVREVRRQAALAQSVVDNPDSSRPERAKAEAILEETPERLEEAQQAVAEMKAALTAAGTVLEEDKGTRPPPKVYKTKQRMYGQRVLRVNQAEGRKHYA